MLGFYAVSACKSARKLTLGSEGCVDHKLWVKVGTWCEGGDRGVKVGTVLAWSRAQD